MIYIIILLIIILFYFINKNIIIEKYFQETPQEQEEKVIYSNNVCGTVGKECSVINNETNTCCTGLYCVRKKGNFHNRICSVTPDSRKDDKSFKTGMTKLGDYINGLKNTVFIEDCPLDEEGNEISNNYKLKNMCGNGFYKIPIPCMRKKKNNNNDSFKFPETTLFSSVGDRDCIK
jgi:hypothetical protein